VATRILATHVGSLPRPASVAEFLFAQSRDEPFDADAFDRAVDAGVHDVVRRQVEAGIDIVSDGEMAKVSYATYIARRFSGFAGDSPRIPPADLEEHPEYLEKIARSGGTPSYRRPKCVGPIRLVDPKPLADDIARLKAAMAASGAAQGFMNAPSPGIVSIFQPSDHHATHEAYLIDLAEALAYEYEQIVASGLILQVDAPDLALGRHMLFKQLDDEAFLRMCALHVEAINHGLRRVPADRVRMHICWGNYEGPHTRDIPVARILPTVLKAKPRTLLFEATNVRHAHEWTSFRDAQLPDDLVLVPGCLDSTSNYVEHPELVAQTILRFADIVGRDRVIAGTDCGFGTFAGFGAVMPSIVWTKFAALAEGARIASARLWPRAA
jgi:5-methyltetrahydropteroyltriglutamate--homocysteine methyltransferase